MVLIDINYSYCRVDDSKFLLGDLDGQLHVLILGLNQEKQFLKCSPLGEVGFGLLDFDTNINRAP